MRTLGLHGSLLRWESASSPFWIVRLVLLLFCCRTPVATAFPEDCWDSNVTNSSRYGPLQCWLQHLKVNLPDQSFQSGLVTISVNQLECSNFTVGGIDSEIGMTAINDDAGESLPFLVMHAYNVSALCQGKYQASAGFSGHVMAYALGTDSALDWTIVVQHSGRNRPVNITTIECSSTLQVDEIYFTGSTSAKIINLFRKTIASYVSDALQGQLCPGLQQLDGWLTKQLHRFNEWLDHYLHPSEMKRIVEDHHSFVGPNRLLFLSSNENPTAVGSNSLHQSHPTSKNAISSNVDWMTDIPVWTETLQMLQTRVLQPYLHRGFLPNASHCGGFANGWNGLFHALQPDPINVTMPWRNFSMTLPNLGVVELQLDAFHIISGWDTMENITLWEPQNETDITMRWVMNQLQIQTPINLNIKPEGDAIHGDSLMERFFIQWDMANVDMELTWQIAMRKYDNVTVGIVTDFIEAIVQGNDTKRKASQKILGDAIESIQLREWKGIIGLESAQLTPDLSSTEQLEEDIDKLFNDVIKLALDHFPALITDVIAATFEGPARSALNNYLVSHAKKPVHWMGEAIQQWNWTSPLVQLNKLINDDMDELNKYIDCAANVINSLVEERFPNIAGIILESFEFMRAGTIRKLHIMSPQHQTNVLQTAIDYGGSINSESAYFVIEFRVGLEHLSSPLLLRLEANIGDVRITQGLTVALDVDRFHEMSFWEAMNRNVCILSPATVTWNPVTSNVGLFEIRAQMIDSITESTFFNVTSHDYPFIHDYVTSLMDWITNSLQDIVSAVTISSMHKARSTCTDIPTPDIEDDAIDHTPILLIVGAVVLFAQPAMLLLKRKQQITDLDEDNLNEPLLNEDLPADSSRSFSLMHSPRVTYVGKIFVPVLILCTMILLASSNMSVGASVTMVASFAKSPLFRSPPLFSFGLVHTAKEMFQARIYPLFFLVVVFSGIWPYMKLMLLFASWVTPTTRLSASQRGKLLMALDSLGKFSLVDIYVLVLMVVAFRYHLDLEGLQLDVFVTPQYGFFGFLLATTMTLVAGHILVFYHRRAELHLRNETDTKNESVIQHAFHDDVGHHVLSPTFRHVLLSIWVGVVILLGIGMNMKSFVFEIDGVAGMVIGDKQRAAYSLISLGSSISASVENPTSAGMLMLQLAYYFYAVVTPFMCLASLFVLLVLPLSIRWQLFVLSVAEIANAWSAVEVFVLSIAASVFEISTFASFMIGDKCDLIDHILQEQNVSQMTTCYAVRSFLAANSFCLITAVLLNSAWTSLTLRLAHLALDERIKEADIDRSPSLVTSLAAWAWTKWMFESAACSWDADNLVVHEILVNRSQTGEESEAGVSLPCPTSPFDACWDECVERDPAWKEWKEAPSPLKLE